MPTLESLRPELRGAAEWFFDWLKQLDARFTVTSARRSSAEQQALYDRYRAGDASIPLALPPGTSMHERGLAFDVARIGVRPADDELLAYVGEVWRSFGLHWAGPTDPVHFEGPKSWRDLARKYDVR